MIRNRLSLLASFAMCLSLIAARTSSADDAKPASDEKPIRALLVIGGCCHDYAHQKDILTKGISQRANVEWTIAYDPAKSTDHKNPVYNNPDWAKGFDVVVHDECSADVKDIDFVNRILEPHKHGLPAVVLHCGMHCYRTEGFPKNTPWFEFTGMNTNHHGPQLPIAITFTDKQNPIVSGMQDWTTIHEELYHAESLAPTTHALATGKQSSARYNDQNVVVWTNDYNHGTKVFCTTLGHNNETCNDPRYLDLITRGLLWSVGKLDDKHFKPAGKQAGANAGKSQMQPEDLAQGKPVTASSQQGDDHAAALAVDGDPSTRWCAANDSAPQWLQVDLGKPQDLTGCRITWEFDEGDYRHKIEGSADAKTWATLVDRTQSPVSTQVEQEKFTAKQIRYVRLNITGLSQGKWASLYDFEIYGTRLRAAPTAQASPTRRGSGPAARVSTPQQNAASLKAPAGFDLSVFASPPEVAYPTALAAAPTGEVFVAIDEDGSLGKEPGRGRVLRLVDTKHTGHADQITVFAKMEHPRGLVWDDGVLYVLHPPFLTAYYDDNGDGVADRSEVLVRGISTEKMVESRGADHTTNGIRMGIDGWIYIAMGDFGAFHAVAKDGTSVQFRGGGVVRIRPDGTGLERYSEGQRNIYDVAIDPLMNVYTRDNTNDGDNWNDRLSYIAPSANYGYPRLFMHFPGEFVDCLADYGGGSPCGSLFIDEPGLPGGLYTVEWGNSVIDHHPLTPDGANFKAGHEKFMNLPRGTDMDLDGSGRIYASSWANGGFSYSGPNVGYVIRLTRTGSKSAPFPDLKHATDEQLLGFLASPSAVCRQATQRQILRRGDKPVFDEGLPKLALPNQPLSVRAAAIFTLKLLRGEKANETLANLAAHKDVREFALRALADRKDDNDVSSKPFVDALADGNPRVRLIAAWGLGRLGRGDAAARIVPLLADSDFLVSHIAVQSLASLRAYDACLKAVDPSTPNLIPGALRVLQLLHETQVVDGLAQRLTQIQDSNVRGQVYAAVARLCYREADWDGSWWSTRPDTSGPYYKTADWPGTARVKQILASALTSEKPEVVRGLIVSLQKNKVDLPEAAQVAARLAAHDPTFRAAMVDLLVDRNSLSADQVAMLRSVATSSTESPALRAKALHGLEKNPNAPGANEAAIDALTGVLSTEKTDADLSGALNDFIRDTRHARSVRAFATLAESDSAAQRELGYSVLLNVAHLRTSRGNAKASAEEAIDRAWARPQQAASLLHAIARTRSTDYAQKIASLRNSSNAEVARAARAAAAQFGLGESSPSSGPLIDSLPYETVVVQATKIKGDAKLGAELFVRQGCVNCHTTSAKEPPKGPLLAGIATRYSRPELIESILKPSAKISQGFETQWFKTADDVIDGFVTRESGDQVELRNATGSTIVLKKSDIKARGKRNFSIMPEGLAAKLTPHDLASLLAYLESLKTN